MSQGVVLISFGKRGYGFAAVNLAASIKYYSPNIPITLYADKLSIKQVAKERLDLIDSIKELDESEYLTDGVFDPAKIKTNLYKYCDYDYTLYLDVDAIVLKDINPIFDELKNANGYYFTHIIGLHTIDKGRDFEQMQWAWADDVWKHYKLKDKDVLPSTNSSFQFIKKGKESKELFKQEAKNYQNKLPLKKLRMTWGKTQPDELYLNIALAQKGITGKTDKEYIYLPYLSTKEVKEVREKYYILSLFGSKNMTPLRFREYYDIMMYKVLNEMGFNHHYKLVYIYGDKHVR